MAATQPRPGSRGISAWGPTTFFNLNLLYLALLAMLLICRWRGWLFVNEIPDPIGGLVPIGVPWYGALGAWMISTYGIFDHNHEWDTRWNYWHALRPFVGAILAVVAFLIFVGLINATGSDPNLTSRGSNVGYLVLAFIIGFREETFRLLVKRATDILLGPGIPGQTPPSAALTAESTGIASIDEGDSTEITVILSNLGPSELVLTSILTAVAPEGVVTIGQEAAAAPSVIPPLAHKSVPLHVTAAKAGSFALTITASGSFGRRNLTLEGRVVAR